MKYIVSVLTVFMLVACGQQEEAPSAADQLQQNLTPIEVELLYDEEEIALNEAYTFDVLVTQGEDFIEDASEVEVEIWTEGSKEASEMLETSNEGEGIYRFDYTFTNEVTYFIQPHVTARDMHRMPLYELSFQGEHPSAGDPTTYVEFDSDIVDLSLTTNEALVAGEEGTLLIEVTNEGEPLQDGTLRLELWQHGDEGRTWLDTTEVEEGTFEVTHTFPEQGDYHIIFHIEDDHGLHEHINQTLEID